MKAVYILGNGSVWQNNEIRYSIRSLKYVPFIDDVIVVGECPDFLKVKHIYVYDGSNRVENVWRKMEVIAEHIKEPFLFMNDDMFFTKTIKSPDDLPLYYHGTIQDKITATTEKASGKYREMLERTDYELNFPKSWKMNCALHYPLIINPIPLRNVIRWRKEFVKPENQDLSFRICYGAYDQLRRHVERPDCKLWKYEDYTGQDIFSISDRFLSKKGMELFEQLYPDKSQWEIL